MIAATGLRWVLTVLFAALAGYGLWRGVRHGGGAGHGPGDGGRVGHLLHAVMAVAMAVMVWPRGMDLPATPQVVFFSLAALWFPAASFKGAQDGRGRALLASLPHALAMAAMAWMLHGMSTAMAGRGAGGGSGSMADMPGMSMQGDGGTATMTLQGVGERCTAGVLAAVFLLCALGWLARGFDLARAVPPRRATGAPAGPYGLERAWDLGCHGLMALGTAVMLVVMA